MLRYFVLIREAARLKKGQGCKAYEQNFRQRQAFRPMAWNAINQGLWLKCMPLREESDQPSGCAKVTAVQPVPGNCFDFNKL